jgi:hypothetical protein
VTYLFSPNPYKGTNAPNRAPDGGNEPSERERFEREVSLLNLFGVGGQGTVANFAYQGVWNAEVRLMYQQRADAFARELRTAAQSGRFTWRQAAEEANFVRNEVMYAMRLRSTAVGRAIAEKEKLKGVTLNAMIEKKTFELYKHKNFYNLAPHQRNQVYKAVVESSAKSNPRINAASQYAKAAGRALIVIAVSISVYEIYTADDKMVAVKKEGAIVGGGIGGGILGGGVAGLACGPGAVVCVSVGAFVGGVLGAVGVSFFW